MLRLRIRKDLGDDIGEHCVGVVAALGLLASLVLFLREIL